MGTSQSAVARLESGDGDVRLSSLQRYADALGSRPALASRAPGRRMTIVSWTPDPGPTPEADGVSADPGRLHE